MKLRKVMLLTALTAAIASANLFAALADEEDVKNGWELAGNTWVYYENGQLVKNRLIYATEDDGRGNYACYYVDENGAMVTNVTKEINGKTYTFSEDGSYLPPYVGATKGKVTGNSFVNTWANIRLDNMVGDVQTDVEAEDEYTGEGFASIGSPKITHDLYLVTSMAGDLEIFYADMSAKPAMDAASFATEFANLHKGKNGQVSAVSSVTIAGQTYSKVTVTKKKKQIDYYCRKQDSYMVVIATSGSVYDAATMQALVNSITTAQ